MTEEKSEEGERIAEQMRLAQSSRDQEKCWDKYFEEVDAGEEDADRRKAIHEHARGHGVTVLPGDEYDYIQGVREEWNE
jgi:hypothetical protein